MENIPIISVSFANDTVAYESYSSLYQTTNPCEVWVWDNHYPFATEGFLKSMCEQFGYRYMSLGENVGMYKAYNAMLGEIKNECVILHDGDHYIKTPGWNKKLGKVMENKSVAVCTVNNNVITRELMERGFNHEQVNGVDVLKPHQVIVCTCGAWRKSLLDSVGGLAGGHKYYGGNEIAMWGHFNDENKYYVLKDVFDDKEFIDGLADWEYMQYKLLYAHKGLKMSFAEYVKNNTEKIDLDDLLESIFG